MLASWFLAFLATVIIFVDGWAFGETGQWWTLLHAAVIGVATVSLCEERIRRGLG